MTDLPPSTDPFAGPRANLRDTVKWVIAALAALAAAILAGSPLTSFGTLAPGMRLVMAIIAGSIGMLSIFWAIYIAFRLLVSEPFFLSDLEADTNLSAFINKHATDLLPAEISDLKMLVDQRKRAREEVLKSVSEPSSQERARAQQLLAIYDAAANRLVGFAYYERLRLKLIKSGKSLFALALCAVTALGAFAWAANPLGKASESGRSVSEHQGAKTP